MRPKEGVRDPKESRIDGKKRSSVGKKKKQKRTGTGPTNHRPFGSGPKQEVAAQEKGGESRHLTALPGGGYLKKKGGNAVGFKEGGVDARAETKGVAVAPRYT